MALRRLDNAMPPLTPERPKKQPKVCTILPTKSTTNDENVAPSIPPPPTATESIDYISSNHLKPLSHPHLIIHGLIEGLEAKDWLKVCDSLNDARRLAIYHSSLLLPILEKVMLVQVKAMKNPRSALCKTSIMAASDVFKSFGDTILDSSTSDAFDQMLLQLLLKASQDKKFVCEEAERALKIMVDSMTPLPLLQKLKSYGSHTNPRVRAKAAVSLSHCVPKMGLEGMKEYGLVSMIQMAADLLNDRLPEAREAARSIVTWIHKSFTEGEEEEQKEEAWQNFCQSSLPAIDAHAVVKITLS